MTDEIRFTEDLDDEEIASKLLAEVDQAVAKGAALLDEKRPGWRDEIDVEELNLSSIFHCVLGQLYGVFGDGMIAVGLGRSSFVAYHRAPEFGFNGWSDVDGFSSPEHGDQFDMLRDRWIREIGQSTTDPAA